MSRQPITFLKNSTDRLSFKYVPDNSYPNNYPSVWNVCPNINGAPKPLEKVHLTVLSPLCPEPIEMTRFLGPKLEIKNHSFVDYETFATIYNTFYSRYHLYYYGFEKDALATETITTLYSSYGQKITEVVTSLIPEQLLEKFLQPEKMGKTVGGEQDNHPYIKSEWQKFLVMFNLFIIYHVYYYFEPNFICKFFEGEYKPQDVNEDILSLAKGWENTIDDRDVNQFIDNYNKYYFGFDRDEDLYHAVKYEQPLSGYTRRKGIHPIDSVARIIRFLTQFQPSQGKFIEITPILFQDSLSLVYELINNEARFYLNPTIQYMLRKAREQRKALNQTEMLYIYCMYFDTLVEKAGKKLQDQGEIFAGRGTQVPGDVYIGGIGPANLTNEMKKNMLLNPPNLKPIEDRLLKLRDNWMNTYQYAHHAVDHLIWVESLDFSDINDVFLKEFIQFLTENPIAKIKVYGVIGGIKNSFHLEEFMFLQFLQWSYYLSWCYLNATAKLANPETYIPPGEEMWSDDKKVHLKGEKVINSCFDVGILETADNSRPWWFYQPVGFGFLLIGDVFGGSDFWAWIKSIAHECFSYCIELLKKMIAEAGKIIDEGSKWIWDQLKNLGPILIGGALLLGSGVIGFHYVENKILKNSESNK